MESRPRPLLTEGTISMPSKDYERTARSITATLLQSPLTREQLAEMVGEQRAKVYYLGDRLQLYGRLVGVVSGMRKGSSLADVEVERVLVGWAQSETWRRAESEEA